MTASHSPILDYDSSDEYRPEPVPAPQAPAWRDGSLRIGIHTSIAGDIAGSLDIARRSWAATRCRFFPPARGCGRAPARAFAEATRRDFARERAELGLGPLVIHANYLINLASLRSGDADAVDSGVS